jgi:sec-independent protein translocase protein TatA
MGGLSVWHWLIVIAVLVVLFGSARLPRAARALGRSMRILRSETRGAAQDEDEPRASAQRMREEAARLREEAARLERSAASPPEPKAQTAPRPGAEAASRPPPGTAAGDQPPHDAGDAGREPPVP